MSLDKMNIIKIDLKSFYVGTLSDNKEILINVNALWKTTYHAIFEMITNNGWKVIPVIELPFTCKHRPSHKAYYDIKNKFFWHTCSNKYDFCIVDDFDALLWDFGYDPSEFYPEELEDNWEAFFIDIEKVYNDLLFLSEREEEE